MSPPSDQAAVDAIRSALSALLVAVVDVAEVAQNLSGRSAAVALVRQDLETAEVAVRLARRRLRDPDEDSDVLLFWAIQEAELAAQSRRSQ